MFCFLILLLKISFDFDTDRWMLIKYTYRDGRTANHQNNGGMENYGIRPLNKPITAIMSQHTRKCMTENDIV